MPKSLALLLPWLNKIFRKWDPELVALSPHYPAIRRAIADFVKSFDGSAGASHIVAEPNDTVKALDNKAIDNLEALLRLLLEQGFDDGKKTAASVPLSADNTKLQFTVCNAPGTYVLRVQGPIMELIPFLVAHLLITPSMIIVKRCKRSDCEHFIVTTTATRGRPQTFCSASCRVRNAEQLEQHKSMFTVSKSSRQKI